MCRATRGATTDPISRLFDATRTNVVPTSPPTSSRATARLTDADKADVIRSPEHGDRVRDRYRLSLFEVADDGDAPHERRGIVDRLAWRKTWSGAAVLFI